jgi:hypothetical protein
MKHTIDTISAHEVALSGKSAITPMAVKPLSLANQTPASLLGLKLAALPVGYYRGQLVFYDVDKQVNQPLVLAERKYIMGILDGRTEGYDLKTLLTVAAAPVGTAYSGALTVPAGQVWYINAVAISNTKDVAATLAVNWRCSLWPDLSATPNAAGQAFHAADIAVANNTIVLTQDLFGLATVAATIAAPVGWLYKNEALRLPGGTSVTLIATTSGAPATGGATFYMKLYGYVGKQLVA